MTSRPASRPPRDTTDRQPGTVAVSADRAGPSEEGSASAGWDHTQAQTICDLLAERARANPTNPAVSGWIGAEWVTVSWGEYRAAVLEAAAGLTALGLRRGECVAIVAGNRTEHLITDQAVVHAGGAPVTLYSTLSIDQIVHCVNDCSATVAVLEDQSHLARWQAIRHRLPSLRTVVLMDSADEPAVADARGFVPWSGLLASGTRLLAENPHLCQENWAGVQAGDPACLVYTSGSTGDPKGVVLTHTSLLAEIRGLTAAGLVPEPHTYVAYLPLAHVVERVFSLYLPMRTGGHVFLCPSAGRVFEFTRLVRPTLFFGVPRIWEKLVALARSHVRAAFDETEQATFQQIIESGIQAQQAAQRRGQTALPASATGRRILAPVRAALGLDKCALAVGGAAPSPPAVGFFVAALGIPHLEGYGLSETSCVATINRPGQLKIGTVGRPLPGVRVRIDEDGEIQVAGEIVSPGYWRQPSRTAELFTADGWLRTGDLGSLDADGFLTVTGRAKELIITSYGKNVSPAPVEGLLTAHPLITQAVLIGDGKPFISALLVVDPLEADRLGRSAEDTPDGADAEVRAVLTSLINGVNARLSAPEKIKRFVVLDQEWTVASGELTPTMKLRRKIIHERNAAAIASMYNPTR